MLTSGFRGLSICLNTRVSNSEFSACGPVCAWGSTHPRDILARCFKVHRAQNSASGVSSIRREACQIFWPAATHSRVHGFRASGIKFFGSFRPLTMSISSGICSFGSTSSGRLAMPRRSETVSLAANTQASEVWRMSCRCDCNN